MSEPSLPTPPQGAPRKASRGRIVLMLLLGGPALAVGGCALFLANVQVGRGNADLGTSLGGIGFLSGVLAFVVGAIWGFVRFINRRFVRPKEGGS